MALLLTTSLPEDHAVLNGILDGIARSLSGAFTKAAPAVRVLVGRAAVASIQAAPEYESLLTGSLRGELGVVSAEPVLRRVCKNIADGVVVTVLGVRRSGRSVEGGLRIELLKGDYSEVLGTPGGSFTSEGGYEIDWLQWLTLEGDRVIVAEYSFVAGFPERSRTGQGIMRRPGAWRVPPEFSGTPSDNWLTRALGSMGPEVERILQEQIGRRL